MTETVLFFARAYREVVHDLLEEKKSTALREHFTLVETISGQLACVLC